MVSDWLRYGEEHGFPEDWADDVLQSAASEGDLMTVFSFFIRSDIDRKIDGHRTALMHAAANGQLHVVKFLVEKDVDVSLLDFNNKSASEIASENGHHGIASFIDIRQNDDWDRIRIAEELVMDLRREPRGRRLDELLELPKYAPIAPNLIELPKSDGNYSWFRITDRVTIGFHNKNGNVFLTWLIDEQRIDDF